MTFAKLAKIEIGSTLFMVLIFLIGIAITTASFKIAGTVVDCSINAQNAVRGLLVMGTALICIPITILAFNCVLPAGKESLMRDIFILLLLLINISVIGMCSVIHNECEASRKYTQFVIPLSVFATIGSGGYLGYKGYNKFSKSKDGKSKSVEVINIGKGKGLDVINAKEQYATPSTPVDSPSPTPSESHSPNYRTYYSPHEYQRFNQKKVRAG
jgi:hypothetical protein